MKVNHIRIKQALNSLNCTLLTTDFIIHIYFIYEC